MLEVEIIVQGRMDADWSDWLGGLAISNCGADQTMLSGVVQDQAAVYGLIARMRDFGFQFTSVRISKIKIDDKKIY